MFNWKFESNIYEIESEIKLMKFNDIELDDEYDKETMSQIKENFKQIQKSLISICKDIYQIINQNSLTEVADLIKKIDKDVELMKDYWKFSHWEVRSHFEKYVKNIFTAFN